MARATMTGETLEATEAIAQARGIGSQSVRTHRRPQVKSTVNRARELAEETGVSVSEAITDIAKRDVVIEKAEKAKRVGLPLRYVKIDKLIRQARRDLRSALEEAREGNLDAETVALLGGAIDATAALIGLLRSAIAGDSGIDWDAELKALTP
jgi:hypothetical protein